MILSINNQQTSICDNLFKIYFKATELKFSPRNVVDFDTLIEIQNFCLTSGLNWIRLLEHKYFYIEEHRRIDTKRKSDSQRENDGFDTNSTYLSNFKIVNEKHVFESKDLTFFENELKKLNAELTLKKELDIRVSSSNDVHFLIEHLLFLNKFDQALQLCTISWEYENKWMSEIMKHMTYEYENPENDFEFEDAEFNFRIY